MCVQKVFVRDLFRSYSHGSYFNCGHCIPCLVDRANYRTGLIRSTNPKGCTTIFCHLTYDNKHVPFVLFDDVKKFVSEPNSFRLSKCRKYVLFPVYRQCNDYSNGGHFSVKANAYFIGYFKINVSKIPSIVSSYYEDLENKKYLKFLHLGCTDVLFGEGRISIFFRNDFVKFINRFRKHLFLRYSSYLPIKYYFAPEYGPTTFRIHFHLILWLPSFIDFYEARKIFCKSWPFADSVRTKKYFELAISAASYVSQYVNCGADVPLFLQKAFALKPSHSFGCGFDDDFFNPTSFVLSTEKFIFSVKRSYTDKSGNVKCFDFSLPRRVRNLWFPKPPGFSRMSFYAFYAFIGCVFNMEKPTIVNGYTRNLHTPLYKLPVNSVNSSWVLSTWSTIFYWRKNFLRAFNYFSNHFNFSLYDYCLTFFNFYKSYSLTLYRNSVLNPENSYYVYDNLDMDVASNFPAGFVRLPACELPSTIHKNSLNEEKYYKNIKHRTLSQSF